jgi:hypothetical protein
MAPVLRAMDGKVAEDFTPANSAFGILYPHQQNRPLRDAAKRRHDRRIDLRAQQNGLNLSELKRRQTVCIGEARGHGLSLFVSRDYSGVALMRH